MRLCESDMASKEENRIFVGGLSWDVTERQLENAFNRYGKIIECQVFLSIFFFRLSVWLIRKLGKRLRISFIFFVILSLQVFFKKS